jgi:hypothetical protein
MMSSRIVETLMYLAQLMTYLHDNNPNPGRQGDDVMDLHIRKIPPSCTISHELAPVVANKERSKNNKMP